MLIPNSAFSPPLAPVPPGRDLCALVLKTLTKPHAALGRNCHYHQATCPHGELVIAKEGLACPPRAPLQTFCWDLVRSLIRRPWVRCRRSSWADPAPTVQGEKDVSRKVRVHGVVLNRRAHRRNGPTLPQRLGGAEGEGGLWAGDVVKLELGGGMWQRVRKREGRGARN